MIAPYTKPNLLNCYTSLKPRVTATLDRLRQPSIESNYHPRTNRQFTTPHIELDLSAQVREYKIAKILGLEVIEPYRTKWASPTVFAAKNERHTSILLGLQETKRSYSMQFDSHFTDGRIHRLTGKCNNLFYITREQQLLAKRNFQSR